MCEGGAWADFGPCEDPDECTDDAIDSGACGAMGNGERNRTCVNGQWSIYSPCTDPDEVCGAGELQDVPCGLNGRALLARQCRDGVWQAAGECADPDVCVDGASRSEICGPNGRGRQVSGCRRGQWGEFEACEDADVCLDGLVESEECGLNGTGQRSRACVGGQWTPLGPCLDNDTCQNGSIQGDEICGLNGRGRSGQVCEDGQWSDARCVDPDICVDGEAESRGCGRGGQGDQDRSCDEGQWSEWTPCDNLWVCPDPENPECGPPGRETCNGLDEDHDGVVDEGLIPQEGDDDPMGGLPPGGDGECVGTPFECEVNSAIERGLQHLRDLEEGQGHFDDDTGRHNFLGILALLEQEVRIPGAPAALGYVGLAPADQRMVVRLVRTMITEEDFMTNPDDTPYAYTAGGNLAALTAYIMSGGPNNVGAPVTVVQAMQNTIQGLHRVQGDIAPNNLGGWNYGAPAPSGDLSTTHFVVLGLSAAAAVVEEADAVLPDVANFLMAGQDNDGGSGYRPSAGWSSSPMTAAALRTYRRIGIPTSDPRVQQSLGWLLDNWVVDGMEGPSFNPTSTYYYFWAVQHALSMSGDDGLGAALYAEDFGLRDPGALGYPEEEPSAYFDLAYTLLQWQDPEGVWGTEHNGSPRGWTAQSSHLFALMTLRAGGIGIRLETNRRPPQCADEIDNDGDGAIDLDDPDCAFACTPFEAARAACRNLLDDDEDGLIDFPEDLGCAFPDDDSEDNPPTHACSNLLDDDGDGLTDYPEDPGCVNPADADETDPECSNGMDDDDDGRVDYPLDPGCEAFDDLREADEDGEAPACLDDEDNDEDGLIDFPIDLGCVSAADDDESDLCGQGIELEAYPVGAPSILIDTANAGRNADGLCGGANGPDKVLVYDNPINANLRISVNYPETVEGTGLYVRRTCDDVESELGCRLDEGRAELSVNGVSPGPIYIFVDHLDAEGGAVRLSITPRRLPAGCSDRRDNDEDGFIDLDDPGCTDVEDVDERDPENAAECADGEDNDEDGHIDFPFDAGCTAQGDSSEADPDVEPACSNGLDDDGNGLIDFPLDAGCTSRGDDTEMATERRPQCQNDIDDDGNGLIDYPFDPGCSGRGDTSERVGEILPACADEEDNDEDGLIDYPVDPGCVAAGDPSEEDPRVAPACANALDDDDDGIVDFPFDPGCLAAGDDDETDPEEVPACANGVDDDNNGRVDYPDDLGCDSAGDATENFSGELPPRCVDAVDNDLDGLVDLEDPGCMGSLDDDETDMDVVPACADGEDNDADGVADWPEDEGCAAQGDLCEEEDYTPCGDVCVDLINDPNHCGACDTQCEGDLECITGVCGGVFCDTLRELIIVPADGGIFNVDTRNQPRSGTSCGGGGPQVALGIALAEPRTVTFEIVAADYDTYMHLRTECDDPGSTLLCDDDGGDGLLSRIRAELRAGVHYAIIDGFSGRSGQATVQVTVE